MARNEWLVPIALGVAATAAAWLLLPAPNVGPVSHEVPAATPDAFAAWKTSTVLLPAPETPAGPVAILHVAHNATSAIEGGTYFNGIFSQAPHVGCDTLFAGESCDVSGAWIRIYDNATSRTGDEPRFAMNGYVIVRVTFFLFTQDGKLAASNDAANATHFPLAPSYLPRSRAPWYFGNGTAPPGTLALPDWAKSIFAPLRGRLVGLPVGAVASARLESAALSAIYNGPLFATVRIEGLERAA